MKRAAILLCLVLIGTGGALLFERLHGPPVYPVTAVMNGLLHRPQTWEGRTILMRATETGWTAGQYCLEPQERAIDKLADCQTREAVDLGPTPSWISFEFFGTPSALDRGSGVPIRSPLATIWYQRPLIGPIVSYLWPRGSIYRVYLFKMPLQCPPHEQGQCIWGQILSYPADQ